MMIWLALFLLSLVAMAPLALTLRRGAVARGRREAAIALHRAQLAELNRDLAERRIAPAAHANAVLEVQRRLPAAAEAAEAASRTRLPCCSAAPSPKPRQTRAGGGWRRSG